MQTEEKAEQNQVREPETGWVVLNDLAVKLRRHPGTLREPVKKLGLETKYIPGLVPGHPHFMLKCIKKDDAQPLMELVAKIVRGRPMPAPEHTNGVQTDTVAEAHAKAMAEGKPHRMKLWRWQELRKRGKLAALAPTPAVLASGEEGDGKAGDSRPEQPTETVDAATESAKEKNRLKVQAYRLRKKNQERTAKARAARLANIAKNKAAMSKADAGRIGGVASGASRRGSPAKRPAHSSNPGLRIFRHSENGLYKALGVLKECMLAQKVSRILLVRSSRNPKLINEKIVRSD